MLSRLPVLLAAAFLVASPLRAQTEDVYALRPGDRITTELFTAAGQKVDVVTGDRVLDRDGNVYLPYIGSVHLAGLDESGCRKLLVERYSHFYDQPVVNVKVQLRVNITGSVGRPGQYFLDPTATILDALSGAGGVGPDISVGYGVAADPQHVRLVRDGKEHILDMRADAIADSVIKMRIHSGDWIHVPPQARSRIRDDITFWGSVASFASSILAVIVLIKK